MANKIIPPFSAPARFDTLHPELAANTVEKMHYLRRRPAVSFAYGIWQDFELVGVCTFGVPPSHQVQKSACPSDPKRVIELNRLWVDDRMPRNTESWFVSRCLKALPPYIVVSYADTAQGHVGFIYRACNFNYGGLTRKNLYDWITPGLHSRATFRCGQGAKAEKVLRSRKLRYWTTTGNRREQKKLANACGWPSLEWNIEHD